MKSDPELLLCINTKRIALISRRKSNDWYIDISNEIPIALKWLYFTNLKRKETLLAPSKEKPKYFK